MSTRNRVTQCPVPSGTLLARYVGQGWTYTDCYDCDVPHDVVFDDFVHAFYTTWLFRVERLILSCVLRRPITDRDADMMLSGQSEEFAAWRVERRGENEILLCDKSLATGSWFGMQDLGAGRTRLMFGSVVVADEAPLHVAVRLILPIHALYSKALLGCAQGRICRRLS